MSEKDDNFSTRCAGVFSGLDAIKFKDDSSLQQQPSANFDKEKERPSTSEKTKEFKQQESIFRKRHEDAFKRPARPSRRKYTKYSLANVSDITDRSNSQAAFSFLRQLREQREASSKDEADKVSGNEKITFKKPVSSKADGKAEEARARKRPIGSESKSGHGQAQAKKPSNVLSHLNYDEEED